MSALMANTPEKIEAFQLLALKGALKLETLGMHRSRGPSAAAVVRQYLGSKTRDKRALLAEFEARLRAMGVLAP